MRRILTHGFAMLCIGAALLSLVACGVSSDSHSKDTGDITTDCDTHGNLVYYQSGTAFAAVKDSSCPGGANGQG